jgi:hypothetical protein
MRAILLLSIVTAGCGAKSGNGFELDVAVEAPAAASALVDDKQPLPATGGVYSQGFASVSAAARVHGTVATLDPDGSVRATATYEVGSYCAAEMPLLRETLRFVESVDSGGAPTLALDRVECEKSDGSGVIVTP